MAIKGVSNDFGGQEFAIGASGVAYAEAPGVVARFPHPTAAMPRVVKGTVPDTFSRTPEDLKDYPWSSYAAHGLGQTDGLVSGALGWVALGATAAARQGCWRQWVHEPLTERELAALRGSVTSGRPFGSESWAKAIGLRMGLPLTPQRRGRPRKHQQQVTAAKK
jgi:hypothetical protein